MPGKNASLSRANAARRAQMLTSIGRSLREGYDTARPLPDRLAALVRRIEQSADQAPKKVQD